MEALAGTPSEPCVTEIGEVATALEEIGHGLLAADALADAALVARRAGRSAEELESRAMDRYAACGTVPVLGELPELEWVGAAPKAERSA